MTEFKMYLENYNDTAVKGSVKILADTFNMAVSLAATQYPDNHSPEAPYEVDESQYAISVGSELFKKTAPDAKPIVLSQNDQTYLLLEFMKIASKIPVYPAFEDHPASFVINRANAMFEGAVEKNLIKVAPTQKYSVM